MIESINKDLLLFLNSLNEIKIIEQLVNIFVDIPIFFLPIFLVSMWIYYTLKNKHDSKNKLLIIFYSTIIWVSINLIIQQFIFFERPEEVIKWVWKLLLNHIPDTSFPSDHSTVSFSFLFSLFFYKYYKIWLIFLPFFILMNLSRVIAWVHWPFDIIWWIIIWFFSSYICYKYLEKLKLVKNLNEFIIKILKFIKL